jgi:hypothetical protein
MKLAKTLACSAAALCLASSPLWAAQGDPSFEEQGSLVLLAPVDAQALYGVDEDGDGVIDYLVLEQGDTIAFFVDEEEAATGAY